MAHIEWLESYSCGIELIDDQHKEIISLVNRLGDSVATQDRDEMGEVLNRLVSVVINHFEFEEELMEQSGYGYLKAHKKLHDRFVEKLVTFTQRYDAGECIIEEIRPFMQNWVSHHISEDRDYCQEVAAELNASQSNKKGWFARTFGTKP